ncbi:MAG: hypothetical protein WCA11_04185 [Terracidiphilus sp.]
MQAAQHNLPQYSPLLFLVFFAALWSFISIVISLAGGWYALSKRFRAQSEPCGETKSAGPFFYTVYMRWWGHYSNVIRMTAADDALYLSVLFPFRIGNPPLCIPWREIELGKTSFFWRTYVELTLGHEERIPMRISQRMARNLGILDGGGNFIGPPQKTL